MPMVEPGLILEPDFSSGLLSPYPCSLILWIVLFIHSNLEDYQVVKLFLYSPTTLVFFKNALLQEQDAVFNVRILSLKMELYTGKSSLYT